MGFIRVYLCSSVVKIAGAAGKKNPGGAEGPAGGFGDRDFTWE